MSKIMIFFLLLLTAVELSAAEVMYVTDKLYLGLYSDKGDKGDKKKTLISGTKLFIDAEEGAYSKVETEQGDLGWVKNRFLVSEAPAIVQLRELESAQAATGAGESAKLTAENKSLTAQLAQLQQQLVESQQSEQALQTELGQLRQSSPVVEAESTTAVASSAPIEQTTSADSSPGSANECPQVAVQTAGNAEAEALQALQQKVSQAVTLLTGESVGFSSSSQKAETVLQLLKQHLWTVVGVVAGLILVSFLFGMKWVGWRIRRRLGGDLIW